MAVPSECDSMGIELAAQAGLALKAFVALVQLESLVPGKAADMGASAEGARRRIARGERLADALLSFAGCRALHPAAVATRPLLNDVAGLLRHTLDASIEVQVEVADSCPVLWLDPQALEDALLDLAINARDAMPEGGLLAFHAVPKRLDGARPGVARAVSDTGAGMTDHVAARAARPLFTTKPNSPMAGLGLASVDGFARQSGGSMELQTAPGAGTTITLHVPALVERPCVLVDCRAQRCRCAGQAQRVLQWVQVAGTRVIKGAHVASACDPGTNVRCCNAPHRIAVALGHALGPVL